jgi:tetratricopeptide (TPR) repeat protein
VRLYQPTPRFLIFVASSDPLNLELQLAATGRPLAADTLHYSYLGLNGVADLIAAIAMDETGLSAFAAEAPISTDDDNRMATRSRVHADGLVAADLVDLFADYDPLRREGSWIYTQLAGELNFGYLADRLIRTDQRERAVALTQIVPSASSRSLIAGLLYQNAGQQNEAADAYVSALRAEPRNLQARFRLIESSLGALSRGTAAETITDYANGLSGSAAAVLQGWAYGASRDWVSLARLDNELARSRVTDAWYPQVAWLRALWRANVTREPERYANDAIRLIDRALVLAPDDRRYSLRALSALVTGDADYMIESFRYLAASMRVRLRSGLATSPAELATMRSNLAGMERRLHAETFTGDPLRTRDVLDDIEELLRMIE